MASILFKILRIWNSQFKYQYVKNESLFLKFFLHFWILYQILNILKEKMIVIANVFPKLQTLKIFVRKLSQEHRFRTGFGSQHVKAFQLLAKSPRERFYHVLLSFSGKLIWNMSPVVLTEILGKFVNTLTATASILSKVVRICNSQFKCNYLKNKKLFLNFLFDFWNLHQILKILREKMIIIANVFPKYQTVKILVRPLSKKRRFRTRFDSEHVKASQMLAKSPWELFYHVFSSFWGKLIWKMSPLVLGEILGVFVNTLTADGKYPVQGCENLHLPIQMQLSEKPNSILCSISWIYINF